VNKSLAVQPSLTRAANMPRRRRLTMIYLPRSACPVPIEKKNKTLMPVIAAVPQRVISGTSHSHSSTSMVAFDWQGMAFNNCSVVLGLRGTVVELEAVNFSKSVRLKKKKNNKKKTRKRTFLGIYRAAFT